MEGFFESVEDLEFKVKLQHSLNNKKPFQNFKRLVDNSYYRQDWFDFKKKTLERYVEKQINNWLLVNKHEPFDFSGE
jgi:hypothetical protein